MRSSESTNHLGLTPRSCSVLGVRVDEANYDDAVALVLAWGREASPRYVCVTNVHVVMEAHDDPDFRRILDEADLVAVDGMPVVWASRQLGLTRQSRVFGPEFVLRVCQAAAGEGLPVAFYGGTPEVLNDLVRNLRARFPDLRIVLSHSPPFRPLTAEEDAREIKDLVASGARIVFIGLGCPKQERWMHLHRDRLPATAIGVGWAFEALAGRSRTAPRWMQRAALEWVHRLMRDPKRLWRRYAKHNPRFLALIALQLTRLRRYPAPARMGRAGA